MKGVSLLALAGAASATSLLLPLYLYPYPGSVWDPVYDAIEAYPDVDFQIIVNPDSGPGGGQYPGSDYTSAVAQLKTYPNVAVLGYVHTLYGEASIDAVEANITTYAGWSGYTASRAALSDGWAVYTDSSIAVDGIFFDETSDSSSSQIYDYMQTLSTFAYDSLDDGATLIFNMGTQPQNNNMYDLTDVIVACEVAYADYDNQTTIDSLPSDYLDQTSIIINSFDDTADVLASLIANIVANGIQSTYFTSDCCYNTVALAPGDVANNAADLAAANA